MNIFFTGCTHFDHANIIKLADRPFDSVEEMNETMIARWNKTVGHKDVVYHLGDFGYINDRGRADHILGRLKGYKFLIKGNHDDKAVYQSSHWQQVYPYFELKFEKRKFILFHYPIEEWDGAHKDSIHLHAHTHHHSKTGRVSIKNRINATVEAWNYTTVSIDRILGFEAGRSE